MNRPVFFDSVEPLLCALFVEMGASLQGIEKLVVIRDLSGRVRFLVDRRPDTDSPVAAALVEMATRASERLGPRAFPADQAFLYADELASDVTAELESARLLAEGPPRFVLLDRQVSGQAWSTVSAQGSQGAVPRVAFFSFKGGVGRSTAAAVAAWHLAKKGRNVLVLDLDLEAPGLSSSLLPAERQPECGIVDWFVEDAVGQGDVCLDRMAADSPLALDLPGQIQVVPSHGARPGDYLAKLGRCYLDLPPQGNRGPEPWTRRLVRLIAALEQRKNPDVTLLDLRAGLSDLSAVPLTDLGAEMLLFALDTDQTWTGYRLLLEHWQRGEAIRMLRERLHLVAALVPETDRDRYLDSFRQRAWDLMRDHAYDEVPSDPEQGDVFSFDLMDDEGPHAPIPIYWNRGLASIANLHALDETLVAAAFGRFLEPVGELVELDEEIRS
ncbi:MAG TPA: P-loop NTPase [Thermoanaerobaculaceae bacterium]|nr:P-loop NTPase [Thermoanaerobaculaceae bacterium]